MTAQDIMKRMGVKQSVIRMTIYNYLFENRTHPTAEEIYNALSPDMPTLSKTTVYNTVNLLAENGIINPISIEGTRIRYDVNNDFHAHFLCNECKKIFDVMDVSCPNCTLDGFTVKTENVFYSGCCKECADKKNKFN